MATVHQTAQTGFGKGTNDLYDRARPSYPSESLLYARSKLPEGPLNVLEIAAGTGLFTRALLNHPAWKGSIRELRAVEPSEGMRETFQQKMGTPSVPLSLSDGTFTATGQEDAWADVAIIAQAWHWAHPNYEEGLKEIARVLKPTGVALFIWNLEDRESAGWVAAGRDIWEKYEGETPQFRKALWESGFKSETYGQLFLPEERHYARYILPTNQEGVINRALSKSYIAILSPEEKDKVKEQIIGILEKRDKTWIDKDGGFFEYPYTTTTIVAKKKL